MDLHSDHPYWLLKNGLLCTYPAVKSDLSCQVLIMGGGISGALAAARLVEEGLDVVVVDKREFASGSTCASTALLLYEIDEPLVSLRKKIGAEKADTAYKASNAIFDKLPDWIEKAGGAWTCGYRPKPSVYFASGKKDVQLLRDECDARKGLGLSCRVLEAEEFASMFSFEAPLALVSDQAAECDSFAFAHGLLGYAQNKGVRLFDRTKIDKLEEIADSVRAVTDSGFTIKAEKLVVASGYESETYLKQKVAQNLSTFVFISEPLDEFDGWWDEAHIWETAHPYIYMRTTPDGRIIVGGEDEEFRNPVKRDALLPHKIKKLEKRFREMFPRIPMEVAFSWAGTFAETPDGLPRIGLTSEWKHAYFAMGYGGNGITFSMIAAEIIAGEITGKPMAYANAFAFDK